MNRIAVAMALSAAALTACSDPQCASGEHKVADMCYPNKRDTVDESADGDEREDASSRSNARSDAAKDAPDVRPEDARSLGDDAGSAVPLGPGDAQQVAADAQTAVADTATPSSDEPKDAGADKPPADKPPADKPPADKPPVEVDPCAPVNGVTPCATNATCSAVGGKAVCACRAAYVGDGKTCSFDSSCSQLNCDKNAECVVTGSDARECRCRTGFMGTGTSCSNTNECASSPCGANADCKDTEGSYECSCREGYEKRGTACAEIDECKTSPCARGRCVDQVASRRCDCAGTGYHGESCEIDDCSTLSCAPGTRCENVSGSAKCVALCGNKKLDDGEECDWAMSDELPGYSCTADCQAITFLTNCDVDKCQGNGICAKFGSSASWCTVPCNAQTLSCPTLPNVSTAIPSCGSFDQGLGCAYRCQSDANCPAHFRCDPTLVCIPR